MHTLDVLIAVAVLAPSFAAHSTDTRAFYRFENGVAGDVASGVGSILDYSSDGNHGTPSGDPVYRDAQCSFSNLGLELDGGDDFIALPGQFVFHEGFGDATFEFSIRSSPTANATLLFTNGVGGAGDGNRYHLMVSASGDLALDYRPPNSGTEVRDIVNFGEGWSLDPGVWTSLAVVRTVSGDVHAYRFYKNGVEVATGEDVSPKLPTSDGWRLGRGDASGWQATPGVVDEVRMSDRALSPHELLAFCVDCNGNGISDGDDIDSGFSNDCDGNGLPDECQIASDPSLDCDGDLALDSCQVSSDPSLDCDGDNVLDVCQIASDPSLDCDGDLALDSCQVSSDPSLDCDGDNVLDVCQVAADPSLDQNGNGILDSCECAFENYCLAAGNSSGQPAVIGAAGSASLTANDLTLTVSSAPAFQFGLFIYGSGEDFFFVGDGAICVKPPIVRLKPIVLTDAAGTVSFPLDLSSPPFSAGSHQVAAFETWHFQFWFRDPTGGPAGFNFSDGLAVTFCP